MQVWIAIAAALLVASVKSTFLILGSHWLPIIETLVFLISLAAYIKLAVRPNWQSYFLWSAFFLVITLLLLPLVDFLFNKTSFNLDKELVEAGTILVDFVAGALFGFAYRWISDGRKHV